MAIGTQGSVGKGTGRSGPRIGKRQKTGRVGKTKSRGGSAISLGTDKTKVAYPTTTTTV
jgi:hypothetical protein